MVDAHPAHDGQVSETLIHHATGRLALPLAPAVIPLVLSMVGQTFRARLVLAASTPF
jgi:hypothetical protein